MESSAVDNKLAKYGFRWETNPYRIVDLETGNVVKTGMEFDLTEKALNDLRNSINSKRASHFR